MKFEINKLHLFLVGLVLVLVGIIVAEYYWMRSRISVAEQQAQEARLKPNLDIGKLETIISSQKKLDLMLKDMSKEIQDAVRRSGEEVKQVINIKATNRTSGGGNLVPILNSNPIRITPSGTDKPDISHELEECCRSFEFKDFRLSAYINVPNRGFKYTLEQRFNLQIITTENSSGVPIAFAELTEIDDKGKTVSKMIFNGATIHILKPTDKEFRWSPKLEFGGAIGADFKAQGRGMLELAFTPFSYGLTRNDNTFRFLRIGMGYDGEYPILTLSLAGYNLGEVLPLITDLWIWPSYGFSNNHMIILGIGKTL